MTGAGLFPTTPRTKTRPLIEFCGVRKSFVAQGRNVKVIDRFDLGVYDGEFICVIGPSGSGKSTILNMVAGLLPPSTGEVTYGGEVVRAVNTCVSYLTQHDTLLPWRTTAGNIGLPLEVKRVPKARRVELVDEIIETVGLSGFAHHYPGQLSGGMRKRVMLARILIQDPATILMDEPFGPLDAQLKLALQAELLRLWTATRKTIIFVTHDIMEAITLADRVVVFSARPSRIKMIEDIDLPRPRDVHEVRFVKGFERHYRRLRDAIDVHP